MEKIETYVYGIRFFYLNSRTYELCGSTGFIWEGPALNGHCSGLTSPICSMKTTKSPHKGLGTARCGIHMFKPSYYLKRLERHSHTPRFHNLYGQYLETWWQKSFECIEDFKDSLYRNAYPDDLPLLALVQGSGKTIEHEYGYRIAHAKVLYLYSKEDDTENTFSIQIMKKISPAWNSVPVVSRFTDFNNLVREFDDNTLPLKA